MGIIFYLHPYSNNLLKRLVKTPKVYFYDTGLICYLTRWSSAETLENGAMNGAVLENYVVSEIAKTYLNCGMEPYMYYYRDKGAVICLEPKLGAIDRDNFIVPVWMI